MDFLETVFKTMDEAGDMGGAFDYLPRRVSGQITGRLLHSDAKELHTRRNQVHLGVRQHNTRQAYCDEPWLENSILDRGLDVFQPFDSKDAFSLAARLQSQRLCKKFEVTYLRSSNGADLQR